MRITKLELENIGVFDNLKIVFPKKVQDDKAEVHIFTGENGTGKTTILQMIAGIIKDEPNNTIKRFRYTNSKSKCIIIYEIHDKQVEVEVNFNGINRVFSERNATTMHDYQTQAYNYNQGIVTDISFAFFAYSGYRRITDVTITTIGEVSGGPFDFATNFNYSINPESIIQWIANTKTKEALELIKNGNGQPQRYRKAIERIEQVITNIIEKSIEFVMETDPLGVFVKVDNQIVALDLLPDGLKSIISWIADLLMRMDRIKWATDEEVFDRNFILFLDEIEVHLHPAWQRKILPVVQKLFKNAQIFVSTHSPFIVGSVDAAWVYKLENVNGNAYLAEGFPILSSSGKSYQLVLDEVFGIESEFSENLEKELQEFYTMRAELLHKDFHQEAKFIEKARELAEKSPEVRDIVGREIRQLNRLLQKEYAL